MCTAEYPCICQFRLERLLFLHWRFQDFQQEDLRSEGFLSMNKKSRREHLEEVKKRTKNNGIL